MCSSRRSLVKAEHESKRRGKCAHETAVPLCEITVDLRMSECLRWKVRAFWVESETPQDRDSVGSLRHFMGVQRRSINMRHKFVIEISNGRRTPKKVTPQHRFLRDGYA
jgi:hypothetical protein